MIPKADTGLTNTELKNIISVLKQYPSIQSALIFGSRAKGNYKTGSDVDIALKGGRMSFRDLSDINYVLNEETPLIYFFDVIDYSSITNPDLKNHIDRVGIELLHD